MTPLRFVVVGGGRIGEIRCACLVENGSVELVGFVDRDRAVVDRVTSTYGGCGFVALCDALDALPNVDAVWIATPTDAHKPMILAAAAAGKHVAVEKPVSMGLDDVSECYEACTRAGVRLWCALQRRVDPSYQSVANSVAEGELGTLQSIHAVFRDHPCPPIEFLVRGGDPFHDLGTHDIDFLLSITDGEMPTTVYARGSSSTDALKRASVMDTATIMLGFESGLNATIELSRGSAYGYDQRFEVFGSNGTACAVENTPANGVVRMGLSGVRRSGWDHSFPERFREAFRLDVAKFVELLQGTGDLLVTEDDVRNATRVVEACRISALSGDLVRL